MRNIQTARAPQVPCLKITHIVISKINVRFIRSASIPDILVKRYDKEIQAWRALANEAVSLPPALWAFRIWGHKSGVFKGSCAPMSIVIELLS